MDSFLKDINYSIFTIYVYNYFPNCLIKEDDFGKTIINETKHYTISFLNNKIIEFIVYDDENIIYYLHFCFVDFLDSLSLFHDFISYLNKRDPFKVLICCSSALTSSYLVHGLEKEIKKSQETIIIHACDIHKATQLVKDYHMILLAPQVRYALKNLYHYQNVSVIPTQLYATYDFSGIMDIIHEKRI